MRWIFTICAVGLFACGDDLKPPPRADRATRADIVSASGRVRSATYTFDVVVGHPVDRGRSTSATHTLDGASAVRP